MKINQILAKIATLGPIGSLPAPGTMGSIVAAFVGIIMSINWGYESLIASLCIILIMGFPCAAAHYRITGIKDSGSVIIDEVVGQWIALAFIPISPSLTSEYLILVTLSFLLFRFFDISKIGPIKTVEKISGSIGVMADDIVAGIFSGVVMLITTYIFDIF